MVAHVSMSENECTFNIIVYARILAKFPSPVLGAINVVIVLRAGMLQ